MTNVDDLEFIEKSLKGSISDCPYITCMFFDSTEDISNMSRLMDKTMRKAAGEVMITIIMQKSKIIPLLSKYSLVIKIDAGKWGNYKILLRKKLEYWRHITKEYVKRNTDLISKSLFNTNNVIEFKHRGVVRYIPNKWKYSEDIKEYLKAFHCLLIDEKIVPLYKDEGIGLEVLLEEVLKLF